jgi:hypothetical protein
MSTNLGTPTTSNYRDESDDIQPTWLTGPIASRYRYGMNVIYDALADAFGFAMRVNLPSLAPPDALQWISSDRQIDQGPNESDASFVQRTIQWLDLMPYAGNSTGVLLALRGAVIPADVTMRTVSNSGDWRTYLAGSNPMPPGATVPIPPVQHINNVWNYDANGDPFFGFRGRWRMWVIIYADPSFAPTPTTTYGGGARYGDGTAFNWAGTQEMRNLLQQLVRKWKSAHCYVPQILVSYDPTLFDPTASFGSPKNPVGTWGHWGHIVSGSYVPARTMAGVSFLEGPQ